MIQIYRGYYKGYLLAVSTNKSILKSYLKDIRHLDTYDIEDSIIEYENATALYDGLFLVNYIKDFYVTQEDSIILDNEVEVEFDKYVETLSSMRTYYKKISMVDIMEKHAKQLKETIDNMSDDLTNKKVLKKLKKTIIYTSDIFNADIEDYLRLRKLKKSCNELDELYYYHLYDED